MSNNWRGQLPSFSFPLPLPSLSLPALGLTLMGPSIKENYANFPLRLDTFQCAQRQKCAQFYPPQHPPWRPYPPLLDWMPTKCFGFDAAHKQQQQQWTTMNKQSATEMCMLIVVPCWGKQERVAHSAIVLNWLEYSGRQTKQTLYDRLKDRKRVI